MSPADLNDRFLRRFVVITVISVSSIIALVVIIGTVLMPIQTTDKTPTVLENWGGLIIGFYFGTFVGLLKDWLSVPGRGTADSDPAPETPNPKTQEQDP